ncbi:MAG: tetratricopeptide repeat protein, partial [Pseudomonadota bacterium]
MTSLDEQLAAARRLLSAGREGEGLSLFEAAFPQVQDHAQRIDLAGFLGLAHGRAKRWTEAERWFGEGLKVSPDNPALLFELGEVHEAQGKFEEALSTILLALNTGSQNARHFLAAGTRLMAAGRGEEALQVWSLGDDMDPMLTRAHTHPQADETTKVRSRSADQALRQHFHALYETSMSMEPDPSACERVARAVWCQTHPEAVTYAHPQQKPQIFYLPDLDPVPVFGAADLPWTAELEAATPAILEEYTRAIGAGASGEPYVHERAMRGAQWDALRGQKTWEALHLFKNGEEDKTLTEQFPKTLEALS